MEPAASAGRDLRPSRRQPAAIGRLARRARRPPAHPGLPRRSRRGTHPGADSRHRPRHQPGDRDDGRLRRRQDRQRRARRGGPRRPALEGGFADGLPDAHQPEHARALRPQHPRDRTGRPRGRCHPLLRRGQPERDHGPLEAGGHGLRHRPRQPPQVLFPAARRRRARRRADRRLRAHRPVPAGAADRPRRGGERCGPELRSRPRGPEVDRPHARLRRQLRRLRPLLRLHPQPRRRRPAGGVRHRGAERQLPDGEAREGPRREVSAGCVRAHLHARVRPHGCPGEARARDPDPRHRQAPARLRLPPADDLLPAAGR